MEKTVLCYNRTMDKSILNEVIAAEKDVQRCIEQEEERLRNWLDQVKRESADAVDREERNDGSARQEALARARQDAEQRAQDVKDEAAARAARMEKVDDALLTGIILKRLPRILLE